MVDVKSATCIRCGAEFRRRGGRQQHCNPECRDADSRRIVSLVCQGCGTTYQRFPWEVKRGNGTKYCGPACYHNARTGVVRGDYKEPEERTCPVCQKVFLVGGRGRPPRDAKTCSVGCQRVSRYRKGTRANALNVEQAAYLAGLIDGEGCVMVNLHRDVASIRLVIANTSRAVMDWLCEVTGVGAVITQKAPNARSRVGYLWMCNAETAESVLLQTRPYMVIKPVQADIALDTQQRLRDPALKADRSWQLEAHARMKSLNRRGPLPVVA